MHFALIAFGFAIAFGVVSGGVALTDEVLIPTYDLSESDSDMLHSTATSGKRGLEGFRQTTKYPTGDMPYDVTIGYPDDPYLNVSYGNEEATEITAPPVQLGEAFLSNLSYDGYSSFTPTVDEHGSYVTSVQSTPEASYVTKATMVLANPSTDMFGDDGQASVEEMEAFYHDSQTKLVSFNSFGEVSVSYGEDKETCEVILTADGNELETDAQDDCASGLEADDDEDFVRLLTDRFLY